MLDTITVGSHVSIKIVKQPTNAAAIKTLERVLNKDEKYTLENNRLHKVRQKNFRWVPRGGRRYPIYLIKQHPAQGKLGEQGTVKATADVVADLKSVSRFIEVAKA